MDKDIEVINLREYLSSNDGPGEGRLQVILSEFLCPKNLDVERFLRQQAVDFTQKNQSVTYLVTTGDDGIVLGYFTIAIKPISVNANLFSKTMSKRIARVSELDKETSTYTLSAYLIAQLGKNFNPDSQRSISGEQLLRIAINTIKEIQYFAGGLVVFLETEDNEKLLNFYETQNGFKKFSIRETKNRMGVERRLIQLLRII